MASSAVTHHTKMQCAYCAVRNILGAEPAITTYKMIVQVSYLAPYIYLFHLHDLVKRPDQYFHFYVAMVEL